ncbi:conserved hypothetical protein [delta proteobacterium NaphS2]|nr:conserved hypothetical protein [delta proteobacterium NaphS2]
MTALQIVKNELQLLGYSGNLLLENYTFDDASASQTKELNIPLGAFAQWPPSYRSACIGVLRANGSAGHRFVSSYGAFGAPMFLEVHENHVVRYRMEKAGRAVELESIPFQNIPKAFASNKNTWSPGAIFRAKAMSPLSGPIQLDFFDAGLLPVLKGMIHKKLDRLLKETLLSGVNAYREVNSGNSPNDTELFRLVFRFLAAKIFRDKKHPGDWSSSDPRTVIDNVQKFYGLDKISSGAIIDEPQTQQATWDYLRNAFNFQNLSEEDLAFVYENTLVTKKARKEHGIHATPSVVAELIVDRLPFEDLSINERFVLEPCAGHGVFLVAALRRLRELLPSSWTAQERHAYLKKRLKAIELDSFAGEVCRLSLTLADYPNPDGWEIVQTDVFGTDVLENSLPQSRIVLCNPPFEDFSEQERKRYESRIQSVHKPYEVLRRVIANPPAMLGFVLPKSAIIGGRYDSLQNLLGKCYTCVETVSLPDRIFAFSDQETMLLLAYKADPSRDAKISTKTFWVREKDRTPFLETAYLPEAINKTISRAVLQKAHKDLWNPPLWDAWEYLADFPLIRGVSECHRGIEWNVPFSKNSEILVSSTPKPFFKKGLDKIPGKIEPYWVTGSVYLNLEEKYRRRRAHYFPWEKPKVIINRHILSRGPWRVVGYPDRTGLVCYQNYIGVWPKCEFPLYILAALLNSPVTNAFLFVNGGKRDIRITTLEHTPIPPIEKIDIETLESLVDKYCSHRRNFQTNNLKRSDTTKKLAENLLSIDSLILKAYDFPPRLERKLLDFFRGYPRPVPFSFPEYFPGDFKPCIPLYQYLKMNVKKVNAGELLKRIEPIDSEIIHQFVLDLEERQA